MRSEHHDVPVLGGSIRLRVTDVHGPPLLFLHGGPGGTDYLYKFFARPVARHGYRPIGMFQRGCPGSPSEGPFDVDSNVGDIETVRLHLGCDQLALVGHSWGGFLATNYAAAYPERVSRLILVCPIGLRGGWGKAFDEELERRLTPERRAAVAALDSRLAAGVGKEERARLLVERSGITIFSYYSPKHCDGKPGLAHMTWNVREETMASVLERYTDPTWEAGLRRLRSPAALVYGKDDPIPSGIVDGYRELLPGLMVQGLDDCGHFPWFEEPEAFWEFFEHAISMKAQGVRA